MATPQARLSLWALLTLIIYFARFNWLTNLSLYKFIGWESAPSIGLTRAYWLVLHGKLDAALDMNRLIIVVLIIGIPLLILDAYRLIRSGARRRH